MQRSISRALHAELQAMAAAEPGREVCGLLFGSAERIEAIKSCANVSAHPEDSFEIDPAALIAAHKAERAGGAKVLGCYHSHPNGAGQPSDRDCASATAGAIWLILACGGVSLWHKSSASFDSINLILD